MRAKEFLKEDAETTLYHITLTKNISKIERKGILPLQTSNWVRVDNEERYGGGYIFAFDNIFDAARWAAKWDWEISKSIGSGQISIITFKDDRNKWETDIADPLSQAGRQGQWLKKIGTVLPENIISNMPATQETIQKLLKISR